MMNFVTDDDVLVNKVAEGLTVDKILENWVKIKPLIMEEWGENREALIDLFGKVRDEWIEKDLETWIGANRYSFKTSSLEWQDDWYPYRYC